MRLAKFINLYGCAIGDETKIGAFVEIQRTPAWKAVQDLKHAFTRAACRRRGGSTAPWKTLEESFLSSAPPGHERCDKTCSKQCRTARLRNADGGLGVPVPVPDVPAVVPPIDWYRTPNLSNVNWVIGPVKPRTMSKFPVSPVDTPPLPPPWQLLVPPPPLSRLRYHRSHSDKPPPSTAMLNTPVEVTPVMFGVVSKPSPEIRDVIPLPEVLIRSTSKPIELVVKDVTVKMAVPDNPLIGLVLTFPSKSTVNVSPI